MKDSTDTHSESTQTDGETDTVTSQTRQDATLWADSRAVADQLDFVTAMVVLTFGLSLFVAGVSVVLTDTTEVSGVGQPAVDRTADRLTQDVFVEDGVSTSNRVSLDCISSFLAQNLSPDCGNISSLSSTGQPVSTTQSGGTTEVEYIRNALGLPDTISANISIRDQSGTTVTPPIGGAVSVRSQSVVVNNKTAATTIGVLESTGGGQVTVKLRYTVKQTNTKVTIPVANNPFSGPEKITQTVTGLDKGRQHTVTLIAEQNGTVQDKSEKITFTPLPPTTPSVSVQTDDVTNIGKESAEVSGTVDENDGLTDVSVQYETLEGDTPRQTQSVRKNISGTGSVQAQLTGLNEGEKYRVRFIADGSADGTQISDTGKWRQFQTDVDGDIVVELDTITSITDRTAEIKSELKQTGGETVQITIKYQSQNSIGSPTTKQVAKRSTPGTITTTLKNLEPDTEYINVQAEATAVTNRQKSDASKPKTFTTEEPPLPNIDISTLFVQVSDTGATVTGLLSETDGEKVDVFIEYRKTQGQLQPNREHVTNVSGKTGITHEITGIQDDVKYEARYGATLPNNTELTGGWKEFELGGQSIGQASSTRPDRAKANAQTQAQYQSVLSQETQERTLSLQAKTNSDQSSLNGELTLLANTDTSQRRSTPGGLSIPSYTLGAPIPLVEANPKTIVRPVIVELPSGEEVVWTVEITVWESG